MWCIVCVESSRWHFHVRPNIMHTHTVWYTEMPMVVRPGFFTLSLPLSLSDAGACVREHIGHTKLCVYVAQKLMWYVCVAPISSFVLDKYLGVIWLAFHKCAVQIYVYMQSILPVDSCSYSGLLVGNRVRFLALVRVLIWRFCGMCKVR